MSTTQVQVELGQKVQERAKLSVALTAKKRLRPIPKGTSATRFSIPHHPMDGFKFSDCSGEYSVPAVSGAMGFEKDRAFPSRDQFARSLEDYTCLKHRLVEPDDLLDKQRRWRFNR